MPGCNVSSITDTQKDEKTHINRKNSKQFDKYSTRNETSALDFGEVVRSLMQVPCSEKANSIRYSSLFRCHPFQSGANYSFSRGYCSDAFNGNLTHLDKEGKAKMVDVSAKRKTKREAVAMCKVHLGEKVFEAIRKSELKKGNALDVARIAGINGAKQTSFLIPLCHNIPLSSVSVDFEMDEKEHCVTVTGKASSLGQTGVEMEALTAVTISALTIYDMCKSISHQISIENIKLVKKTGGKSDFSQGNNI